MTITESTNLAAATADHNARHIPDLVLDAKAHAELVALTGGPVDLSTAKKESAGMNSDVFYLTVTPTGGSIPSTFVLKQPTNPGSALSLAREAKVIQSIPDSFPCPTFLGTVGDHVVMTLLPGLNGYEALKTCRDRQDREQLMEEYGRTLRDLHATVNPQAPIMHFPDAGPMENPTVPRPSRTWMKACIEKFEPIVRTRAALPENADDKYTKRVLASLEGCIALLALPEETTPAWNLPPFESLVWCHGDFMLANVLFARDGGDGDNDNVPGKWRVSGVLDWGDAGWADGRHDVMAAVEIIEQSCPIVEDVEPCRKAFLAAYGVEDFDIAAGEPWGGLYDIWDYTC
ncbi:hypothetical protein HKX48_005856 [Thoreauomyces humboldtii]|nr:hypothetical protein HKX48_005856 [Thoreauomyces humboldtii]